MASCQSLAATNQKPATDNYRGGKELKQSKADNCPDNAPREKPTARLDDSELNRELAGIESESFLEFDDERSAPEEQLEKVAVTDRPEQVVYLLLSEFIGHGGEGLGQTLMEEFLISLSAARTPPEAMVFLNSAVKLLAEGTGSAAIIQSLGAAGTRILACSNSLDYYEMNAKLAIGRRAEMSEIVETLSRASKVITI